MRNFSGNLFLFAVVLSAGSGCALRGTQHPAVTASPAPSPVYAPPAPAPVASPPPAAAPATVPPDPVAENAGGKSVKLWYGTNRKEAQPFHRSDPYGSGRDQKLNYGVCEVLIPKSHQRGSLGSYSRFNPEKDAPLVFTYAVPLEESAFWLGFAESLKNVNSSQKVVLVFIHGYNNSFKDAALRTAQLWADLNLKGVPAFFSWPSRGKPQAYTADEATIDYSEKYLEEFLLRLRAEVGKSQPIHLVAHSMGNRALLRVAAKLQNKLRFGQIILAAPDIDIDVFEQMAGVYKGISDRTTLYVSKTDKPVKFSKKFHDMERVGAPPRFANVEHIDTVEVVAKTGLLELGHSYFAEFSKMLDEISELIVHNPGRGKPYSGQRTDRRYDCARSTGNGASSESCWQITVNK